MTDRELLELAAKAIGLTLRYNYMGGRDENQPWNPLEDDGDALRLAVKLQLSIYNEQVNSGVAYCGGRDDKFYPEVCGEPTGDLITELDYAATRRAIVIAAAEIGKAMP